MLFSLQLQHITIVTDKYLYFAMENGTKSNNMHFI